MDSRFFIPIFGQPQSPKWNSSQSTAQAFFRQSHTRSPTLTEAELKLINLYVGPESIMGYAKSTCCRRVFLLRVLQNRDPFDASLPGPEESCGFCGCCLEQKTPYRLSITPSDCLRMQATTNQISMVVRNHAKDQMDAKEGTKISAWYIKSNVWNYT